MSSATTRMMLGASISWAAVAGEYATVAAAIDVAATANAVARRVLLLLCPKICVSPPAVPAG